MATAADLRALEALLPWTRETFRDELATLRSSTADAAKRYAADAEVLARLAARVPRCPLDERGATPWTSFRREVAIARSCSDRAAAADIRHATRLLTVLPTTLDLLQQGRLTVPRAKALLTEIDVYDDELARRLDQALAEQCTRLSAKRIVQEVRRLVAKLDAEATALRAARKNADRGVVLIPDSDDQASVVLFGPAVPLTRWHTTLDQQARALKAAGDPRPLGALRFDLATSTYPCTTHPPADPTAGDSTENDPHPESGRDPESDAESEAEADADADAGADAETNAETEAETDAETEVGERAAQVGAGTQAGLRPAFVEPAPRDCRLSRPVQAMITVPVETALGLSNDPAWLDGYGWISAPTSRTLLLDAELRRLCVQAGTGQLVDVAARDLRPPPTPAGLRHGLLEMILGDLSCEDTGWRTEPRHDPSPALRNYVHLRDRTCDSPTGNGLPARTSQLDHDEPWPTGPTAAWNLVSRAARTHGLKHRGWTPIRTHTGTTWASPCGQLVHVPRLHPAPPGTDPDPDRPAQLPDPDALHTLDRAQLTLHPDHDNPPHLPQHEKPDLTGFTWFTDDGPEPDGSDGEGADESRKIPRVWPRRPDPERGAPHDAPDRL